MPKRNKNNLESPIASIAFKRSWSATKEDDETSITNSAIFQAKSIESFDIVYDVDSFCDSQKKQDDDLNLTVTFDSALLPDNSTRDDALLMDNDDNNFINRNNSGVVSVGTFGMIESPLIYDDFNDDKNEQISIPSPKKMASSFFNASKVPPMLNIDTYMTESINLEYAGTPSTKYTTPRSTEFSEVTNFLVQNKLLGELKSDDEESLYNIPKKIHTKTTADDHQIILTPSDDNNTVIFNQQLLNDFDSFEAIMSSILPTLAKLDPKNQATILNVILEELSNRKKVETFHDEKGSKSHNENKGLVVATATDNSGVPDFFYAQQQRKEKYNDCYSWGLSGMYEYLEGVNVDLMWAMEANQKRKNNEPYLPWSYYDVKAQTKTHPPVLTCLLLIVHTATLITSYGLNNWNIELFEINPMLGPSTQVLIQMGAKETSLITQGGEWYRLFTAPFLNAGMIQYSVNLMVLAFALSALERYHGLVITGFFYVVPALGGTILSAMFLPEYVTVSSNGGICSILGTCLATIFTYRSFLFKLKSTMLNKSLYWKHVRITLLIVLFLMLQALLGLAPFVDNITNLSGLLYGFLFGISASYQRFMAGAHATPSPMASLPSKLWYYVKKYFCLLLGLGLILSSGILLHTKSVGTTNVTNACGSSTFCYYLGCVELPSWKPADEKWYYCDDCAYSLVYPTMNETTGLYSHVALQCPNQQMVDVNITSHALSNVYDLELQVPTYCRLYCNSSFAIHSRF